MPYADRDAFGTIVALYAAVQEDIPEEFLPDDDPEVIAFLAGPDPLPLDQPPAMTACALRVSVGGGIAKGVAGAYRVAAIQYLDTGTFLAIFSCDLGAEPFLVPNNGISVSIAEWGGDWAVLEVRDHAGGALIDPAGFGFTLHRF